MRLEDGVDLGDPLIECPVGAKHGAIRLHRALHLELDFRRRATALGVAETIEPRQREVGRIASEAALE